LTKVRVIIGKDKGRSNAYAHDEIWADEISRFDCPESDYSIMVVGENHTIEENRYLTAIRREEGHDCLARFLAKSRKKTPTSLATRLVNSCRFSPTSDHDVRC
jgi:hypothetical protein